jgi:P27 family predicted phage terminase small subunit
MGRTGRPRKPDAIKKLEGNPGHRPLNMAEPRFPALISCPNWLTGEGKSEWRRVIGVLSKVPGLLTSVDRSVLASYCQSYARWRQAEHHLEEEGSTVTITGQHGYCAEQPSPWVSISKTYHDAMMRSAREMGFTPSARSGVRVQQPTKPPTDVLTPPKSSPPHMVVERHRKP